MTQRRYLRRVRATIGNAGGAVAIEDLLVRFRVSKESTSTPAAGTIDLFNIAADTERRIHERAVRALLEAGYADGTLQTVFDGSVRRVERLRTDLDRVVRVHVGGKTSRAGGNLDSNSVFIRTYQGTVPVSTIVRDGIETMGLEAGNLSLIPEDAEIVDFQYNGETGLMLQERLKPLGLEWYEENGVVHVTKPMASTDDSAGSFMISEGTGMIRSPTVTDDGIRVITMLDPRIRLDARFKIESRLVGDEVTTTTWKASKVEHSGDNREGEYQTRIEGKALA